MGLLNAVLFYSYNISLRFVQKSKSEKGDASLISIFQAASISGLFTGFINGPTELVKNCAQVNEKNRG